MNIEIPLVFFLYTRPLSIDEPFIKCLVTWSVIFCSICKTNEYRTLIRFFSYIIYANEYRTVIGLLLIYINGSMFCIPHFYHCGDGMLISKLILIL